MTAIRIENISESAVAPFGWMLGKSLPTATDAVAFTSPTSDFWHEHVFHAGSGGEHEILWVKYRSTEMTVARLEVHHLTQQAVVPVIGSIVQILAASDGIMLGSNLRRAAHTRRHRESIPPVSGQDQRHGLCLGR